MQELSCDAEDEDLVTSSISSVFIGHFSYFHAPVDGAPTFGGAIHIM